jgi:hypothetical protein
MRLELEDGAVFEQPSEDDIDQALDTLVRNDNSYAILSQDEMTYIQASVSPDADYDLEYQAGDTEHHYRVSEPVLHSKVVAAFKHYAQNDPAWKTEYNWERQTIGSADGSGCTSVFLIVLVVIIGATTLVGAACWS